MRPTFAEIDMAAIVHNVQQIRSFLPPDKKIMAVVKANAYGHGAIPVSLAAEAAGVDSLAVAIPDEGVELRHAGLTVPILILGLTAPEQMSLAIKHNLTITVCDLIHIEDLEQAARQIRQTASVAIKVDTGMGRIGTSPADLPVLAKKVSSSPVLKLDGIFTHMATADESDLTFARHQLALFEQALQECEQEQITPAYISAAASAGILTLPESLYQMVRAGIILYGSGPVAELESALPLKPALRWVTTVSYVKQVPAGFPVSYGCTWQAPRAAWIATLPVGYADGYLRSLSNRGIVLIGGQRYPVVGRICMDQLMVDVGPNTTIQPGDEAVLLGRQGNEEITATELGSLAGTISYEVLSAIHARVPRLYKQMR